MWTTGQPILKEKQRHQYKKRQKKKKRKRKAYARSLTYLPTFLKTKNKSSSPQVEHNLTSKSSSPRWGVKSKNTACIYNSADLVYFVIQTGIQKSNLNKTRLNVIVKNKNTNQKNKQPPHTHSRLSLIPIIFLRVKLLLSPLNTLLQFIYWWLE